MTRYSGEAGRKGDPNRPGAIVCFRDLIVWGNAFNLSIDLHRTTRGFPTEERFGLSRDLRRTSRSIAYNIAEGRQRRTTKEFLRFIDIAKGSQGELETQILFARELGYIGGSTATGFLERCAEVGRLLTGLSKKLRSHPRR